MALVCYLSAIFRPSFTSGQASSGLDASFHWLKEEKIENQLGLATLVFPYFSETIHIYSPIVDHIHFPYTPYMRVISLA